MRILISVDIEGVSGVCHPEQTRPGSAEYERARLLMTQEANAAAEGAFEGGATEIWVVDGHGTYRNIILEALHPDVRLVSGKPRQLGMMAGLDDCGPWNGVFLLGYHARAGAYGVLAHTINGSAFAQINVDGKAVGEAFINTALAGEYGVPVRLISGDDCLSAEVQAFASGAEIVTVKQALGNRAAAHLSPVCVHDALRDAAQHAVIRQVEPYSISLPLWVEVTTIQPVQADCLAQMPGMQRMYATCVGFEAPTVTQMVRTLNACSAMVASLI